MKEAIRPKWELVKKQFSGLALLSSPHLMDSVEETLSSFEENLFSSRHYDLSKVSENDLTNEILLRYTQGHLSPMGRIFILMYLLDVKDYQVQAISQVYHTGEVPEEDLPDSDAVQEVIEEYEEGSLTLKDKHKILLLFLGWTDFWKNLLQERKKNRGE